MSVTETIHLYLQPLGTEGKRNNLIVAHVEDPYNNLMESTKWIHFGCSLCCSSIQLHSTWLARPLHSTKMKLKWKRNPTTYNMSRASGSQSSEERLYRRPFIIYIWPYYFSLSLYRTRSSRAIYLYASML